MQTTTIIINSKKYTILNERVNENIFLQLYKIIKAMTPNLPGFMTAEAWASLSDVLNYLGLPLNITDESLIRQTITLSVLMEIFDKVQEIGHATGKFRQEEEKDIEVQDKEKDVKEAENEAEIIALKERLEQLEKTRQK